jgi:phospholipase C
MQRLVDHEIEGAHHRYRPDFRRLGPRGSALLISPWVEKGAVFQEPKGPTKTSQFEHSSLSATITNLFNLSGSLGPHDGFLTERDAWVSVLAPLAMAQTRCCGPVLSRSPARLAADCSGISRNRVWSHAMLHMRY